MSTIPTTRKPNASPLRATLPSYSSEDMVALFVTMMSHPTTSSQRMFAHSFFLSKKVYSKSSIVKVCLSFHFDRHDWRKIFQCQANKQALSLAVVDETEDAERHFSIDALRQLFDFNKKMCWLAIIPLSHVFTSNVLGTQIQRKA